MIIFKLQSPRQIQQLNSELNGIDKRVLSQVGAALYLAQQLEYSLMIHLLVRLRCGDKPVTPDVIEKIESGLEGKTLGQLVTVLDLMIENDPGDESTLRHASYLRNHLAHKFFLSYRRENNPTRITALMLSHIEIIRIKLEDEIDFMQRWTIGLAKAHGIDLQGVEKEYDKTLHHTKSG